MTQRSWSRRDFLRRTATVGAAAVGGSVFLGACQSTGSADSIRIGIAGEEPYGFTDVNGNVTGQAPEVARVVLRGMGINDVRAEQVDFGSLIPALNANRYDMVCAGMNITPERCSQAAFSIPDYTALTAFLVPQGNPQQVATFEDIASKGVPLAVLSAAVEQGYAEAAGVPAGNISVYDDQNALLQAVTSGRAYAAALTDISLKWLAGKNPDAGVEVTEGFTPTVNGQPVISAGGFVFRQADNDLRERFNAELQRAHEDGRWLTAASPFGFSEDNLPTAGLTTEQLCSA
jgi:polar amino acid transport system substrate-binding protein